MEVVGAALRGNLNLGAAEATILGIIAIGDDFYAVHGIFRRRDDRCTAPDGAGGGDAVNRNPIVLSLLSTANDLRTIFVLEDAVRTTRLPSAGLSAREAIVVPATRVRAVSERTGSQWF